MSTNFKSGSAAETEAFGRELAARLLPGDVLLLQGDLGAGKTCLTKGIVAGLGSSAEVCSPTFTLANEYTGGRLPAYHIDLYRLERLQDVARLGLEEYFEGGGISIVEWPERLGPLAPAGAWRLALSHVEGGGRNIEVIAPGGRP